MKLSIIVPIYNVEEYIVACLESIFRQGLSVEDYELILVNDGTEDHSLEQISVLISDRTNVKIIEQQNQGLSVARNTGLDVAKGEYILFLDSDDLLIDGSLKKLLALTVDNPDLVIGDYVKMNNEEIAKLTSNRYTHEEKKGAAVDSPTKMGTREAVTKTGIGIFLNDFYPEHCYVWRTLYRKAFIDDNNLRFIPGIYFEDVPFTTECYLKADRCVRSSQPLYIYRQRVDSIVYTIDEHKIMDFNKVIARLWEIRQTFVLSPEAEAQLMKTIYTTFSIEAWYITHDDKLMSIRHEIIGDLKRRVPNIYFTGGIKQRMVSCLFRFVPDSYLWLKAQLKFKGKQEAVSIVP